MIPYAKRYVAPCGLHCNMKLEVKSSRVQLKFYASRGNTYWHVIKITPTPFRQISK